MLESINLVGDVCNKGCEMMDIVLNMTPAQSFLPSAQSDNSDRRIIQEPGLASLYTGQGTT